METVRYKQWTVIDRSELVTQSTTVEEFIEKVCEKLDMITTHSYIAKAQAEYLKNLKPEMIQKEVIVLCDFA